MINRLRDVMIWEYLPLAELQQECNDCSLEGTPTRYAMVESLLESHVAVSMLFICEPWAPQKLNETIFAAATAAAGATAPVACRARASAAVAAMFF